MISVMMVLCALMVLGSCGDEESSAGAGGGNTDKRELPCSVCDDGEYFPETVTEPSATEDGLTLYTCNKCGDSYEKAIPATGSVKLLVIGDASSTYAVTYLDEVLKLGGIDNVTVATMNYNFNSGASIADQKKNIESEKKAYTFAIMENGETVSTKYSQKFLDVLTYDAWDYIVIGQSIPKAGIAEEYSELDFFVNYIEDNKTNANAKLLWNMSWAYNKNSSHAGFDAYGKDQAAMYQGITVALETFVKSNAKIDGILPVGAAIQNLREIFLDGSVTGTNGIQLETEIGAYVAAVTWGSYLLDKDAEEIGLELSDNSVNSRYRILNDAINFAIADPFKLTAPEVKTFKLLAFGNSYSNDAYTYLYKIFASAGYDEVILGSITTGGCDINHHWWNLDDTLEDYHPSNPDAVNTEGEASCGISVNGVRTSVKADTLKERYAKTVAAYDWDFITIQHGPNTVEKTETYSHLTDLLDFIDANLISEDTEIIYHMIWKYNDNLSTEKQHTAYQYNTILDITQNIVLKTDRFDGVIPAATFRQNMVSSFLEDVDISRDYGHMGLTLGRYALGLLWYCYLTGGSVDDVTYVPTADDVDAQAKAAAKADYGHVHLDITEADMLVVREAIENALKKPYEITNSVYTTAP